MPAGRLLIAAVAILLCAPLSAAQLTVIVTNRDGQPLANSVVTVTNDAGETMDRKPGTEIVDQINKQFVPYVKPVYVGSSVNFPNSDNIRHQVYSFSPAKRFVLPLYKGTPARPVVFDKPGIVVLGCNIHDWMIGYIYVSPTPWFAKTGDDGRAVIANLPPGSYHAKIWHPRMHTREEETARQFNVDKNNNAELTWSLELRPEIRPRRAPVGGGMGGYP